MPADGTWGRERGRFKRGCWVLEVQPAGSPSRRIPTGDGEVGHVMTLRLALVAVDARDLCPACLPCCIGGAGCVPGLGRGCLQPHAHTVGKPLKLHTHAQSELIGRRVVDVLIPHPVNEPGVVVVGQRPAMALHKR